MSELSIPDTEAILLLISGFTGDNLNEIITSLLGTHGLKKYLDQGAAREPLESSLAAGGRWILEVSVDGYEAIRRDPNDIYLETMTSFFINTPIDDIVREMRTREPDILQETVDRRIERMRMDLKKSYLYDHVLSNPDGQSRETAKEVLKLLRQDLRRRVCC